MRKIMFNDHYGLTEAVLQGRKTMTRRQADVRWSSGDIHDNPVPKYKVGEVLAVAQSYKDLAYTKEWVEQHVSPNPNANWNDPFERKYPGWSNKMFVKADLMLHYIHITDVRVERLQDISEEDCMREGIVVGELKHEQPYSFVSVPLPYGCYVPFTFTNAKSDYLCARDAFAALIDKPGVGGKGTWERNPWELVYSFKKIK